MWPLEHQGFPLIWPSDLVSDIKWPSFKLDPEIIKNNILSNIYDDYLKNVTSQFSADLTWWPSFWPHMTQFRTWTRNHQDKHFEQDSWWLLQKFDHYSEQNFLIWPGDLVFDPKWPSFELDLELIKTNILSKIHDDCFKNVTARVLTRFSADLAQWPSFLSRWPSFELDLEIIKTNILSKVHDDCLKNVTARVLTKFSADLARWPSFWP